MSHDPEIQVRTVETLVPLSRSQYLLMMCVEIIYTFLHKFTRWYLSSTSSQEGVL